MNNIQTNPSCPGPQDPQNNTTALSTTDRKIIESPAIRAFFATLGIASVLSVIVASCIVTPVLTWGAVPAVTFVAYRYFSPEPENPSISAHFSGLNNKGNDCFINAAVQFLEGTLFYEEALAANPGFGALNDVHQALAQAKTELQPLSAGDTSKVREWLCAITQGSVDQVSPDRQEDASLILERILVDPYPPLPLPGNLFSPERGLQKPRDPVFWLNLQIISENFVENHNNYFWDLPERGYNHVHQFISSPENYFIRLIRFNERGHKIETDVNIPETFYHKQNVHTTQEDAAYEIDRFIVHRGVTRNSGHYVAYRKKLINGVPVYVELNDRAVTAISKEQFFEAMKQAFWLQAVKKPTSLYERIFLLAHQLFRKYGLQKSPAAPAIN